MPTSIDHVQITVAETVGVESRGDYYDHSGALRDMLQNHLMQLAVLCWQWMRRLRCAGIRCATRS